MKYLFLFDEIEVYEVLQHEPGSALLTASNFLVTTLVIAESVFSGTGINTDVIEEFKQTNKL